MRFLSSSPEIVYYDTETTGVKAGRDRIIEIAAYKPRTGDRFVHFVHPGMPIPPEATAISHITDEMVQHAPPFSEVGKLFIEFCGPSPVLVAHNNDSFDRLFLEAEYKSAGLTIPAWNYLDTLKWARKFRPDLPRHSLQALRETFGIAANQAHRAMDDVEVLHQVFEILTDDLTVEEVLSHLSGPVKAPLRMPFGKHQGKPLQEVPKDYVQWLKQNGALDKPDNMALRDAFQQLGII